MCEARALGKRYYGRDYFTGDMERTYLEAAVELGQAVGDSRVDRPGKPQLSVDRLPVEAHMQLVEEIRAFVGA